MSFVKLAYKAFAAKNSVNMSMKKNNIYIAHGLLGNAMNWASVVKKLLEEPELTSKIDTIYSFDMRNHGDSTHVDDHSNATLASDLEAIILEHCNKEYQQEENEERRVNAQQKNIAIESKEELTSNARGSVFIGHSMGGLALIGMLLRRYNEAILLQSITKCTTNGENGSNNKGNDYTDKYLRDDEVAELNAIWSSDRRAAYGAYMRSVNTHFGYAENEPLQHVMFKDTYNHLGHLSAAIIVDITPTAMLPLSAHSSVNNDYNESVDSNLRTLHAMQDAQLDRIHSYTEADAELKRVGISDVALRSFVATNIVLNKDRSKPAHWRCNLQVLASNVKSFQPSIVNWFEHFNLSDKAANLSTNERVVTEHNIHTNITGNGDSQIISITPQPCLLPTLFVFGEKSIYNNATDRQKISAMFPFSTQVVVPKAGHFVHYEQREGFVNAIVPFLSQYL